MNIIWKYIFTDVRERKTRSAIMLLSILLPTTLLLVFFSIGEPYEDAQRRMARGMAGSTTFSITAIHGGIGGSALPRLPSIRISVGVVKGAALYHENSYYKTVDLIEAGLDSLGDINPSRLVNGGKTTDFTGNQVVLPNRFTSKYGIERGGVTTLLIGEEAVSLEMADIAAYDTASLRHAKGITALLPLDTLFGLLGQADDYTEFLVEPATGTSTIQLKEELTTLLPVGKYRVSKVVNEAQIAAGARQRSMPFFLISLFSPTMGILIIYGSYKMITLDRLPVIGTFRSIGATQRTVTRILLLENEVYGVAGGLIEVPADVLVLKLILNGVGKSLPQGIELPIIVSPAGIALPLTVTVAISLLSAQFPVRRVSRLSIRDMALGNVEEQAVSHRFIAGAGVLFFLISMVLPRLASGRPLCLVGRCSLLGPIAVATLIVPLLTDLLSKVSERFYEAVFGNEGRLAARNMRDNKNVSQDITLLLISISAVIAITVVGDFVTAYVDDVFRDAKLQGSANRRVDVEFVEQVEEMGGIELVLPLCVLKSQIEIDDIILNRPEGTNNLERHSPMMAFHYARTGMEEQAVTAFAEDKALLLNESRLERTGFSVGGTTLLNGGAESFDYSTVGSFESGATDVEVAISATGAVSDFGVSDYGLPAYIAVDPDAIIVQIRDLFGETSNWGRTVEESGQDAPPAVGAFLQPIHSITWFVLLLVAMGAVNNLLTNYTQKWRTTVMYKPVGLSNRQYMEIALVKGSSSGLIGAATTIFVSYMKIRTTLLVTGSKITMASELGAATFLMASVMGIMATLSGSVVPILKSRETKPVEEIKFE